MNKQGTDRKTNKMNFQDYFFSLPDTSPRIAVRDEICEKLGIATSSLYDKIRNHRFSKSEMILIADIMQKPIEILFPEQP